MGFVILHISDLHIENVLEYKEKKFESIANILNTKYADFPDVLIMFSGDIANHGKKEEYDFAERLISELIDKLSKTKKVKIAVCPGNHDRLFNNGESRNKDYVNSISKNNYEDEVKNNLHLNDNYQKFVERICPKVTYINEVLSRYDYRVCNNIIAIYSLNNALLSFFVPNYNGEDCNVNGIYLRNQFMDITRRNNDYVFVLMHMPLSYLKVECINYLKSNLSNKIDAFFTGHVHKEHIESIISEDSELLEFTSPAIDCWNMSGFSIISVVDNKMKADSYIFSFDQYIFKSTASIIIKRKYSTIYGQFLSDEKAQEIQNMEIFDGTSNIVVPLDKMYVFPKLSHKKYNNQRSISSFDSFESIISKCNVAKVIGDTHSGKSLFTKYLFEKYRKLGFLPLVCKGDDLGDNLENSVIKQLQQLYTSKNDIDSFKSVDIAKRILIIDNLVKGSRFLFRSALKLFGSIIYTTTSSKDFITSDEEDDEYQFEVFEIEPFYYDKRTKLYENIYSYVKDSSPSLIESIDLNTFTKTIEDKLKQLDLDNTLDTSNIIAMSLSFLKKVNYQVSSSNSVFQAKLKVLIEKALKEENYTYCDCDVAEDILAYVAMDAYEKGMSRVEPSMFEEAISKRTDEYGGRVPVKNVNSFIQMLIRIEVLKKSKDDELSFYDRKTFAHYVAKYAIYKKNNYFDDKYLNNIINNGIYRPINLQILFSIATNYDYRTIPQFFVDSLYDGIMNEPEMKFDNFDLFFKTLDESDDDFKELEISKEKRNEIREKQGEEEEKNRKLYLSHKDDYFYYDVSKEVFLKLDELFNKAMIISSLMNHFSSKLRKDAKEKLAEMLIKIPYAIINTYLSDAIQKLDIIFVRVYDQLSKIPETKVTYQFVKQSIASEIHAVVLSIFDICTRFVRNQIIVDSIQSILSLNKDNMHETQKLMLLSFSLNRDAFIKETKECLKNEKDRFIVKSAKLIGRRFCLDNYEWVEKNHGEFIQLITSGNKKDINSIRESSKVKK